MDVRSDIYSLGCTLWYLLTGEAPFTGSLASVFAQHLGSEPPWEKLRPFPKQIRRLLSRMLRKEPSQRPASAAELRREIERSRRSSNDFATLIGKIGNLSPECRADSQDLILDDANLRAAA